jgi:hypothetical protein
VMAEVHIAEDEAQPERDAEYVARISRRER